MTEEQKKSLETKLWSIANTLRGKMNADEFRDYALGFIFYKYPSERLHIYPNDILNEDGIEYLSLDEATSEEHIITTNWRGGFMYRNLYLFLHTQVFQNLLH